MDDAETTQEGVESADDSEFVPTSVRGAYNIICHRMTLRSSIRHRTLYRTASKHWGPCHKRGGFGWQLKLIPNLTEDDLKKYEKRLKQRWRIEEFFEMCHPAQTFSDLRYRQMYDKHTTGSGYLELIHNEQGDLDAISHCAVNLSSFAKDKEPSYIRVPYIRQRLSHSKFSAPF